jgi:hypothetical protein
MTTERSNGRSPRIVRALDELRRTILDHYPTATFEVARGEDDPDMVHLWTTVDVEDTEEVLDVVMDRMLEMQIEEGLPVCVIPMHTRERVAEIMRRQSAVPRPVGGMPLLT